VNDHKATGPRVPPTPHREQGTTMAIWTSTEFLAQLQNQKKTGIPSSLGGICESLDELHRANTTLPEFRATKLFIVYKETKHWLKGHSKAPLGGGLRQSAMKSWKGKKLAVISLQVEVLKALEQMHPGLMNALVDYEDRKIKVTPAHGAAVKGLQPGYAMERQTYLAGGKSAVPYSGSKVHGVAPAGTFGSLKQAEFVKLAEGIKGASQMYWCTKEQRLRNRITYARDRGIWEAIDKKVVHHTCAPGGSVGHELGLRLFAMDRYGNLFVDNINFTFMQQSGMVGSTANSILVAKNRGIVNHSSICAGREVICAGCLFIWHGQLIHIDNNSGHYAPTPDHLRNLLAILIKDTGLKTSYLRVQAQTAQGYGLYKAETFVAGGPPDWPDQDANKDHTQLFVRAGLEL
jgi:hypothetical protein